MNRYIPVFFVLFLILYSCNSCSKNRNNKGIFNQNGNLQVYDFEKVIVTKPSISGISSLAKNISYIPLTIKGNTCISTLRNVAFDDDKIFVSEDQAVYVFDSTGTFLNKVGVRGRGPDEYLQMSPGTFFVDKNRKEILLPDFNGRKVLIYNYDGTLIGKIKTEHYIDDVAVICDSLYCLKVQSFSDSLKNAYSVIVVNRKSKEKTVLKTSSLQKLDFISINNFNISDNLIYYSEPYNDTIYKIDSDLNKSTAGMAVLGRYKPPLSTYQNIGRWDSNISKYIFNYYLIHDSGKTYFSIYYNFHVYCGDFGGETTSPIVYFNGDQKEGIKDDIDFGPPFNPFLKIKDGLMVDFIDPVVLLNSRYNHIRKESELYKIRKLLNETDNPVIRIVKLNKNV